ncbi:sporulation protein [Streptomyces sp. NPDC023723]|uniref:sporulation protein n=1 Tax=Streptomyces sp. NPDC023723 TaxID=3154323 RepID=UPI0033C64374
MGFRRLFGMADTEAIEVDTQIFGPARPGAEMRGEVVLTGGSGGEQVNHVSLEIRVQCVEQYGEGQGSLIESLHTKDPRVTPRKGEEHRLTFAGRLPWETPVSELGGRALGVVLTVRSDLSVGSEWQRTEDVDRDLLHVSASPLHEAVLDAFAEEGYWCDAAHVVDSYLDCVDSSEQHLGLYQVFVLTDRAAGPGRPEQLEVVFQMNAVGAIVHVREAVPDEPDWDEPYLIRRFPAAHHEVGHVDLRLRVSKVLADLVLLAEH